MNRALKLPSVLLVIFLSLFSYISPADSQSSNSCLGKLPDELNKIIGNYRIGEKADFIPAIRNYTPMSGGRDYQKIFTCSLFAVELNGDARNDYALLLVDPQTAKFRFQILLNQGQNQFKALVTKDYNRSALTKDGILYTSVLAKPAGELGTGNNDYSPLKRPERKVYQAKPAIELCEAAELNADGSPKTIDDISTLCYCSIGYYFDQGKFKEVKACD